MRAMQELLLCSEGPWLYFLGGLAWMKNWKMDVIFIYGQAKKKKKDSCKLFSQENVLWRWSYKVIQRECAKTELRAWIEHNLQKSILVRQSQTYRELKSRSFSLKLIWTAVVKCTIIDSNKSIFLRIRNKINKLP